MGNVAPSTSITVRMHMCSAGKSWLTLCEPMYCSPPSSSVHGILFFAEPPGKLLHNCEKPLKVGSADTGLYIYIYLFLTNGHLLKLPMDIEFL